MRGLLNSRCYSYDSVLIYNRDRNMATSRWSGGGSCAFDPARPSHDTLFAAAAATGLVLGVSSGGAAANPPASSSSIQDKQILLMKEVVAATSSNPAARSARRSPLRMPPAR